MWGDVKVIVTPRSSDAQAPRRPKVRSESSPRSPILRVSEGGGYPDDDDADGDDDGRQD